MSKINYTDKVALYENSNIPAANKVQAADMNEIKNVVNTNYDLFSATVLAYNDTSGSSWKEMMKNKLDYCINNIDLPATGETFINGGWSGQEYGTGLYSKLSGAYILVWFSMKGNYLVRKFNNNYTYKILEGNTYSTSEQVIGTWTDGKTIYRKTYFGNMPNTESNWVDLEKVNSNVETVTNFYGTIQNTSSDKRLLNMNTYETANFYSAFSYLQSTDYIQVKLKGWTYAAFGFVFRVTLEYTKTTD